MSTIMATAASSLNPNAPLFIPAAYSRVEDFSPQWWDLVHTTAWFRDHWFRQHHHHHRLDDEDDDRDADRDAALPDDLRLLDTDDLFYAPDLHRLDHRRHHHHEPHAAAGAPWEHQQQSRHADKQQQHVGTIKAAARRVIHQPR